MTRITLDQLSEFLNSGATLDDTISMIEMLKEYKEEIETGIAEWHDLLPEVEAPIASKVELVGNTHHFESTGDEWGDKRRRKQLHAIIIYLWRMGYVPSGGKLAADRESCTWTIVKGEGRGTLSWTPTEGYTIRGLAAPTDDYEPTLIPTHLIWE
jgi:hypothetical protein